MAFLIGGLLAVLVIGMVVYPFVKGRFHFQEPHLPRGAGRPEGWRDTGTREAIYEEIKTLQLEHELGTIDEAEYLETLSAYRLQAAAAMRDAESLERDLDHSLEEEIRSARSLMGRGDEEPLP